MKASKGQHFCDITRHGILEKLHHEFVQLTDATESHIVMKCLNSDAPSPGTASILLETKIPVDGSMHKYIEMDKMQAATMIGTQFASSFKQKMLEMATVCLHAAYSNLDDLPRRLRKQLSFVTRSKNKFNDIISGHRFIKGREDLREYGLWLTHPMLVMELIKHKCADNFLRVLSTPYLNYLKTRMREEDDDAPIPQRPWWCNTISMDSRQLMQNAFCFTMSEAIALGSRETVIELEHNLGKENIEQILTLKFRFQIGLKGFEYIGRNPASTEDIIRKESWKPVGKYASDYGAIMLTKRKNVRELLTAAIRRSRIVVDHLLGR